MQDAAKSLWKAAVLDANGPTGLYFIDDNAPETGISP